MSALDVIFYILILLPGIKEPAANNTASVNDTSHRS